MASNRVVGITIDIEGRNDGLTKSLQQVSKESAATSSALKSIDSALKEVTDDAQRVELLSQKEELLTKQIEQTNEKLEIMKQVAADAAKGLEDGTVSKEQYAILTSEIAKTEQTLEQLGNQAQDTSNELAGIESGDLDQVGDDAEDAASGLSDAADEAENTNGAFDALGKGAAAVGAAMVAATAAMVAGLKEVGGALVDCTVNAGNYVDEINTLSMKTGVSAETLQEWNYVSGLIDVDVNTMTGSLTKLEKSMSSADGTQEKYIETLNTLKEQLAAGKITQEEYYEKLEEANEKATTGFDKLGVAIYDEAGNFRDNEEVFWDTIDALGQIEDPVQRDLAAMELLGKSAKELNPLIEAGSDKFRELSQEAHDVGYVMDEETMGSFQDFDDQMERFSKSGTAAKNALGTLLLPALSELSTTGTGALQKFTKAVQNSNGDVSVIGNAISEMLPEIFQSINKVLPDILKLVGTAVDSLLQIFIDNLPAFVDTAMSIIEQLTTTLINPENITKIMDAAVTIVLSLVDFILQNMDQIINSAIQIVLAIVNGIASALPQLIPAAVDAILTICETLLAPENLAMILEAALNLVIGLATGIVDALPQLIERLPEIIEGIVSFLLSEEGLGKIIEAGFTLFTGLVTKMPEIISQLIVALGTMLTDLVDYISGDMFEDITSAFGDIFGDIIDSAFSWGADIIQNICDGFASMWDTLTGWIGDIASAIGDFLGFSVPKAGPLASWGIHNPGADMMELYGEGIEAGIPGLMNDIDLAANAIKSSVTADFDITGSTLENTMNLMSSGTRDYSDQLGMINGSLSAMVGGDRQVVIPVYIGQERIETVVANANVNNNFISGGR
jgi:phage-related protein